MLAWVELAQGQAHQALARLTPLAEAMAQTEQTHHLITILALRALACAAEDDVETALAALNQALDLAAPESYIRTFIDYGSPMQQLLQLAADRDLAPDYVLHTDLRSYPGVWGHPSDAAGGGDHRTGFQ